MSKYKCNGCGSCAFESWRALNNHLTHNKECSVIHHSFFGQVIDPQTSKQIMQDHHSSTMKQYLLDNDDTANNLIFDQCVDDIMGTPDSMDVGEDVIVSQPDDFSNTPCSNDMRVENNLIRLLLHIGAPNYANKAIMGWAKDAFITEYKFTPKTTNYKSQIKKMEKYHKMDPLRPVKIPVELRNDHCTYEVTCHNFSKQLSAMFNDK